MTERKSAKVHYVISRDTGYTFCGRYVTMTLQVSRDTAEVTCVTCLRELADPARKLAAQDGASTETTARVRWEPLLGGNFDGYVGRLTSPMFEVQAVAGNTLQPWALRSDLLAGYSTGTDPDELKAEAERWLERFASSLGASFEPATDQEAAVKAAGGEQG